MQNGRRQWIEIVNGQPCTYPVPIQKLCLQHRSQRRPACACCPMHWSRRDCTDPCASMWAERSWSVVPGWDPLRSDEQSHHRRCAGSLPFSYALPMFVCRPARWADLGQHQLKTRLLVGSGTGAAARLGHQSGRRHAPRSCGGQSSHQAHFFSFWVADLEANP